MNTTDTDSQQASLLPSAVILVFVVGYLATGYVTLSDTTRFVPLITAAITLALLAIDMLSMKFRGAGGRAGAAAEGGGVKLPKSRGRELTAILFVAASVAAIYLFGFLPAIPLYLFASIAWLGRQSLRVALIVTVLASLSIYVVFELALSYQLFRGILFS